MFANLNLTEVLIVAGCLIVSLTLHEAMHAFAAHALGDRTAQEEGRLTLNPLRHLDLFTTILLPIAMMLLHLPPFLIAKPVPFDSRNVRYEEYGVALVALAGPFTNLALAVLASLLLRVGDLGAGALDVVAMFMDVNILFFVFNMIPFPPLDGSRLLYAFAPDAVRSVMRQVEALGLFMILAFMLLIFPFISGTVGGISVAIHNFLLQ
jgi:Zn-dependent protease